MKNFVFKSISLFIACILTVIAMSGCDVSSAADGSADTSSSEITSKPAQAENTSDSSEKATSETMSDNYLSGGNSTTDTEKGPSETTDSKDGTDITSKTPVDIVCEAMRRAENAKSLQFDYNVRFYLRYNIEGRHLYTNYKFNVENSEDGYRFEYSGKDFGNDSSVKYENGYLTETTNGSPHKTYTSLSEAKSIIHDYINHAHLETLPIKEAKLEGGKYVFTIGEHYPYMFDDTVSSAGGTKDDVLIKKAVLTVSLINGKLASYSYVLEFSFQPEGDNQYLIEYKVDATNFNIVE